MTRITSFGRKRTYLQAGFDEPQPLKEARASSSSSTPVLKKKKEKTDPKTRTSELKPAAPDGDQLEGPNPVDNDEKGEGSNSRREHDATVAAAWKSRGTDNKIAKNAEQSEKRRLKRIADRHANTVCFACREKGHAAKDCTNTSVALLDGEEGKAALSGQNAVGICYRCGSTKHTLARCRKSINPRNPLPFASCFVCSGKGHLASSCPKNSSKGIYPNGGSCKLCGETSHLAKNCPLRAEENAVKSSTAVMGAAGATTVTQSAVGADEDDFHVFKRRKAQVEKDEEREDAWIKAAKFKSGAMSGVVKSFAAKPATPAKVVFF